MISISCQCNMSCILRFEHVSDTLFTGYRGEIWLIMASIPGEGSRIAQFPGHLEFQAIQQQWGKPRKIPLEPEANSNGDNGWMRQRVCHVNPYGQHMAYAIFINHK